MTQIAAGTKLVNLQTGHSFTSNKDVTMDVVAPSVYRWSGKLYTTKKAPTIATLERYSNAPQAKTPCGCSTDMDSTCIHGVPSWVMVIGLV